MNSFFLVPLVGLSLVSHQEPNIDGPRLASILKTLHDKLQDVEFLWEATTELVDVETLAKPNSNQYDNTSQSSYAYRNKDGATYLDHLEKPSDPNKSPLRMRRVILNGKMEKSTTSSDQPKGFGGVRKETANPGSAMVPGSPERIFDYARWREFIRKPDIWGVKFIGWEDIGGHRCAHVDIDYTPGAPVPSRLNVWVDLERDGHILKQEFSHKNNLWFRVDQVSLAQFPLPKGGQIWLPTGGVFNSFAQAGTYKEDPVLRESHHLVRGSLRLNQGLRDDRFSANWPGEVRLNSNMSGGKGSTSTAINSLSNPQERIDPEGVALKQSERLELAERQAKALDASIVSTSDWKNNHMPEFLFASIGFTILIIAIVLKLRRTAFTT